MRICFASILLLFLWGCAEVPFRPTPQVSMADVDPAALLQRYNNGLPDQINSFNSVVFDYAGQKFLGLGFVEIDRPTRSFRVICLNPMGVKIFDLSGDEKGTTINFALEPIARYGDIAAAVAADIRRIYFDLVPSPATEPFKGTYRIIYRQSLPGGQLEHQFAGAAGDLVLKRYYEDQFISWETGYYEYREKDGKRYPQGIILTNYRDHYQLIVREKEQSRDND